MFKFHSNLLPSALSNLFTPIPSWHKYKTGLASMSTLCIPSVRSTCGKFNIPLRELLFGIVLKILLRVFQEHPTTVFCKITVRRSKYCLDDCSIHLQFSNFI